MAKLCRQPLEKVNLEMKRDFYLDSAEAVEYGLVDHVMAPPQVTKLKFVVASAIFFFRFYS
jgi:ATP-dependent protease ClpP protease subunit